MPKIKLGQRNSQYKLLLGLVMSGVSASGKTEGQFAKDAGISPSRFSRHKKKPEDYTIKDLEKLGVLHTKGPTHEWRFYLGDAP